MRRAEVWLARVLFGLGLAALGYWSWAVLDGRLFQSGLARRLRAVEPRAGAPRYDAIAAATRREARASGLVGRLEIPRLGLSVLVLEGTDERSLRRGVGHLPASAFPGERGVVTLAAHRDAYFHRLGELSKGDVIRLSTPDGPFAYRVDSSFVVPPDRGDLLVGRGLPMLTLVTCYPFHWIGPAPRRFVVRARPADPGAAARPAAAALAARAGRPRARVAQRASASTSRRPAASYTLSRL